ncbi:MAG: hypothetical protein FWG02_10835, partial [Holophagaceae bacterium]|nr:hypothetical protein [Holophagaceae bacterium]
MLALADRTIVFKLRIGLFFPIRNTSYRITLGQSIEDDEEFKVTPTTIDFTTANYKTGEYVPSVDNRLSEITALGTMLYAKVGDGEKTTHHIRSWQHNNGHWTPKGIISPNGYGHFYDQDITKIKAFENVLEGRDIEGNAIKEPMLMVLTTPRGIDPYESRQGALWAFRLCQDTLWLHFAVSLGPGVYSYSTDLDCRNGVIAVSRITGAAILIDIKAAAEGWAQNPEWVSNPSYATTPQGTNKQAIFQTYHITDPDHYYVPAYYGISLLPIIPPAGSLAVATSQGIAHMDLKGITNMVMKRPGTENTWMPGPAFEKSAANPILHKDLVYLPMEGNHWLRKQNLIEGLTITKTDNTTKT